MSKIKLIFLVFLALCFCNRGFSQSFVCFQRDDSIRVVFEVKDSLDITLRKQQVLFELRSEGYISVYLNPSQKISDTLVIDVITGKRYEWNSFRFSSLIPKVLHNKILDNGVTADNIKESISNVLSFYENNGYPFASCFLDSVEIFGNSVSAVLSVMPNQFVVLDTFEIKGTSSITHKTIERLINFNYGSPYNESYLRKLPSVLNTLPYLSVIRSPEVYFYKGKATLILYLEEKKNNRFDGVVGINPNENNGGIEVVGEVNIELKNILKRAEDIVLSWEKIKENSQRFKVGFDYPFLFGSKLGVQSKLNYFRQDTAFANLDFLAGFSYFIDNRQSLRIGWNVINSNSLSSLTSMVEIPSTNSFSSHYLSINYRSVNLDNRLNPRRGSQMSFTLNSGSKRIDKNLSFGNVDYQNLDENTRQFRFDAVIFHFVPVFKKATILLKFASGNLIGDNIFLNELYQLGGLNSLRGFNQQSIFASNYYFGTTEFRYLLDRNSSVFAFIEGGFYESNGLGAYYNGTPFGVGFGVNFSTKTGVFTLTYALGKQNENPILVRNGKVHFGYVSLF